MGAPSPHPAGLYGRGCTVLGESDRSGWAFGELNRSGEALGELDRGWALGESDRGEAHGEPDRSGAALSKSDGVGGAIE